MVKVMTINYILELIQNLFLIQIQIQKNSGGGGGPIKKVKKKTRGELRGKQRGEKVVKLPSEGK